MAGENIMQGTRFAEHGDRSEIEAMAQQGNVPLGVANAPGPAQQVGGPAPEAMGLTNPLVRTMAGAGGQDPLTSGLSVGPGSMPPGMGGTPEKSERLSKMEKLSALALYAESPALRGQAAAALRGLMAESATRRGR